MESVLYWPNTSGPGACPGMWLIYPVTPYWGILVFSFPAGMGLSFAEGWIFVSLPILHAGTLSAWSCADLVQLLQLLWAWMSIGALNLQRRGLTKSFSLCTLSNCGSLFIAIYCEKKLRSELRNALIYGHSNMSWWVNSFLLPYYNNSSSFPLGAWPR